MGKRPKPGYVDVAWDAREGGACGGVLRARWPCVRHRTERSTACGRDARVSMHVGVTRDCVCGHDARVSVHAGVTLRVWRDARVSVHAGVTRDCVCGRDARVSVHAGVTRDCVCGRDARVSVHAGMTLRVWRDARVSVHAGVTRDCVCGRDARVSVHAGVTRDCGCGRDARVRACVRDAACVALRARNRTLDTMSESKTGTLKSPADSKRVDRAADSKRLEKASAAVVATIPKGQNAEKKLISDILLPDLIRGIVVLPPEDRRTQKARARHRTTKIKARRAHARTGCLKRLFGAVHTGRAGGRDEHEDGHGTRWD